MIQKIALRDQIGQWLQDQMLKGKIKSGDKLSLAEISRDIDVSITPIREALVQLVRAGTVKNISNRGFYIPQLTAKEAADIYPTIYALEKLALEKSKFSAYHLSRLESVHSSFEKAKTKEEAVRLDLEFHELLLKDYRNDIIKNILNDLKVRVFFYELHYLENSVNHLKSIKTHHALLTCLAKGNLEKASALLQENWETSAIFIEQQYKTQQQILS